MLQNVNIKRKFKVCPTCTVFLLMACMNKFLCLTRILEPMTCFVKTAADL